MGVLSAYVWWREMLAGGELSSEEDEASGFFPASRHRPSPAPPPPPPPVLPLPTSIESGDARTGSADAAAGAAPLHSSSWLTEANATLARAPPKAAEPRNHVFVVFCFGFSLVGSLFLLVLALLMFARYPYLEGLSIRRSAGAAATEHYERTVVATYGAASLYAAAAMICAIYLFVRYVLEGRRRTKKSA